MSGSWKLRGYTVERLLGSGASGEVWRAHISATGDPVALKRLSLHDAEQARRAHAEAAMLSVLDHPNLVRLHALVPDDDVAVLVLDLADGGSLAGLLAARARLTPGEVITAVAPIAAALAYVHAQGVVHGDVSPANILFTGGGVPLLADLGVARLTGDDSDAESTPAYVDPSVAAGCIPGPPSDVFMLGAVALHALTGSPAWPAPTAEDALAQARRGELGDVAARLARDGVSKAMAAVVLQALVIDPSRRCTAADFALDLRHSGRPIAVELAAGRARADPLPLGEAPLEPLGHGQTTPRQWARVPPGTDVPGVVPTGEPVTPSVTSQRQAHVGRHAALVGVVRTGAVPVGGFGSGLGRPAVIGSPAPTDAVRRARPVIPRPPRRSRRRVLLPAVAVALVAVAGGVVLLSRDGSAQPGRHAAPHRTHAAGPAQPATSTGAQRIASVADWLRTLRELDALRGKAFATRDVELLRRVYVAGPLLRADTALLLRMVPPGCRLVGVRTSYEQPKVDVTGGGATVSTRARLAPSTLQCPDQPVRSAGAVGPAHLTLQLATTPQGRRITAQQVG
ncbi:MAG: serine/threonine-protein kinase [Jatrophihabitans sp.]